MVSQDPTLFYRTIIDNISCANLQAIENKTIDAVKLANVHDFIYNLFQGHNTILRNRGVKLSSKQHKRIAIAKSNLKKCLYLDYG